jgi:hypothetical protein
VYDERVQQSKPALMLPPGKTWPELRDAAIELARLAAARMP